ncbi:exodeoxyribonuclease VII large subunit [Desulfovibrio sp. OttesenSCG-928-F07]|nr:exodeoxyribonuclease VII large subunit [Desulfovibrio sp. OttesenSCG-928-F07]
MSSVFTVRELTYALKGSVEAAFPFVWVRGQVSNLTRASSGHLYFSLKDEEAALAAVWFKRQQQPEEAFDPLTGEVYENGPRVSLAATVKNGDEVICAGRLTVYPPRGTYQIQVELMQDAGKGRLQIEFELLKAELAKQGYFDQARKRALPLKPLRVAIITSPTGAAIHDFLRIAQGRGMPAQIRIYPALVQGSEAPADIAKAFAKVKQDNWAELVVLIRGGGSLEDLWAFNTKPVVEAVFNSAVPVLCGVGHEVDVTLADMVADLRAATPTHAAQLLFKERRELTQAVDEYEIAFTQLLNNKLGNFSQILTMQEKTLALLSPVSRFAQAELELASLKKRLALFMQSRLKHAEYQLEEYGSIPRLGRAVRYTLDSAIAVLDKYDAVLAGLNPRLPLERGYALVQKADGSILRHTAHAMPGEELKVVLHDGTVPVVVKK